MFSYSGYASAVCILWYEVCLQPTLVVKSVDTDVCMETLTTSHSNDCGDSQSITRCNISVHHQVSQEVRVTVYNLNLKPIPAFLKLKMSFSSSWNLIEI